jgi:hypothetical protein
MMTDSTTAAGGPRPEAGSLEQASAFVAAIGLTLDEVTATKLQNVAPAGP